MARCDASTAAIHLQDWERKGMELLIDVAVADEADMDFPSYAIPPEPCVTPCQTTPETASRRIPTRIWFDDLIAVGDDPCFFCGMGERAAARRVD